MRRAEGDPRALLEALQDEIVHGTASSADQACRRLETAQREGWLPLVEGYRLEGPADDSLLHLAALFLQDHSAARLIRILARLCPGLLAAERGGEYRGQTALHIVVSKGNLAGAEALLAEIDEQSERDTLLEIRATGLRFERTVMEGELALHVAALTLNKDMVELLLEHGARLDAVNSLGDTVLHALVRFAGRHPDRTDQVVEMLNFFHVRTCKKIRLARLHNQTGEDGNLIGLKASGGVGDQLSVWFLENNAAQTPLKLAAGEGVGRVCAHILSLDGVYRLLDTHDGLFDTHLYDITELDPVTNRLWQAQRLDARQSKKDKSTPGTIWSLSGSKVNPLDVNDNKKQRYENSSSVHDDRNCCPCFPVCSCLTQPPADAQSVLETICGVGASQAFCLISTDVVRELIRSKWHRLRAIYYFWMLLHLLFMVGLTFYAIYRPQMNNQVSDDLLNQTSQMLNSSGAGNSLSTAQRGLVKAWPWLNMAVSVLYLGLECTRTLCLRQAWHLHRLYHNGLYRLVLVSLSLCLIVDSLWYWLDHHNADSNVFLILALLMGGWFLTFFLRAWRKFSFFTILVQKVLVGDMFRFSIMILLELVVFSAAMYVAYLPTHTPPEEFEDIWTSTLTMFRLMLGLSDIEILSKAPAAWMAVALYVIFVLLTYVLLLNLLIAMMSQTCALVSEDRELQWRMQRLSVLLMLETLLPPRCRPLTGQHKRCRRYSLKTGLPYQEGRYLQPVTSPQANYTDGKAILRRQNLVRTMGFGELTLKLAPAHVNTYSSSPIGQTTKTTLKRVGTMSSPQHFHPSLQSKHNYSFSEEQENIYLGQTGLFGNVYEASKATENNKLNTRIPIDDSHTGEMKEAGGFLENSTTDYSAPLARRRHNSERKNRRTQTDSNGPLSRSYPDGMLRNQKQDPTGDPQQQPVLHYLAVPGGPVLPHPDHLRNLQIGYMTPANLQPRPNSNGHLNHVTSSDAQAQDNGLHLLQQHFPPHIYNTFGLRVPASQLSSTLNQIPSPANGLGTYQNVPAPMYSHQVPMKAKDTSPGQRVQFVEVNDLSTEA